MWHQKHIRTVVGLVGVFGIMTAVATMPVRADSSVVWSDHFNNGVPADSDAVVHFWNIINNADEGANTISESRGGTGLLDVMLAGGTGKSLPKIVMCSRVSRDFNFATGQIALSVKGIKISAAGADATLWNGGVQFSFTSKSTHPWESPDAVSLVVANNGTVQFGWKTAKTKAPMQVQAVSISPNDQELGAIIGLDLTLNKSGYKLVVQGENKSATFAGAYAAKGGFTPWGDSALIVDFQRNTTDTTVSLHYQLKNLRVMRVTP